MKVPLLGSLVCCTLLLCCQGCSGAAGQPTLSRRAPCAVQRGAFLSSRDLGAFAILHRSVFRTSPFSVFVPAGSRLPVIAAFVGGAGVGLIADTALTGRYRRENDRIARARGFKPMKWPLVPLTGDIVRENPESVLEVYQSNYVYASAAAAAQHLALVSQDHGVPMYRVRSIRLGLGDQAWARSARPVNDRRGAEAQFSFAVRVGHRVMTLGVFAGDHLRLRSAIHLADRALHKFDRACAVSA
jgi:hypothetical protein